MCTYLCCQRPTIGCFDVAAAEGPLANAGPTPTAVNARSVTVTFA
jgi:hypothetical protein